MSSSNIISLQSVTQFRVTFKGPLDTSFVDRLFHIFLYISLLVVHTKIWRFENAVPELRYKIITLRLKAKYDIFFDNKGKVIHYWTNLVTMSCVKQEFRKISASISTILIHWWCPTKMTIHFCRASSMYHNCRYWSTYFSITITVSFIYYL